jgi:hypothetical protein
MRSRLPRQALRLLFFPVMRKSISPKKSQDHESEEEDQEEVQPIHRRTGEEEEAEVAAEDLEEDPDEVPADDARDHSMESLDDDDLANMQGPDA